MVRKVANRLITIWTGSEYSLHELQPPTLLLSSASVPSLTLSTRLSWSGLSRPSIYSRAPALSGHWILDKPGMTPASSVRALEHYAFGHRISCVLRNWAIGLARAFSGNGGVPNLRSPAAMQWSCHANNDTLARAAEEVALELDRREAGGTLRQPAHRAVTAAGVGERHHRAGMQEAVPGAKLACERSSCDDLGRFHFDECQTEVTWQIFRARRVPILECLGDCYVHQGSLGVSLRACFVKRREHVGSLQHDAYKRKAGALQPLKRRLAAPN